MKLLLMALIYIPFSAISRGPLPLHEIPDHPFLSPVPNLHLDHYYSAVSNNRAPASDNVTVKRFDFGNARLPAMKRLELSMCLNFLTDHNGNFYGFCSEPIKKYLGGIDFKFVYFDKNTFEQKASHSVMKVNLRKIIKNDLPLNLGYFTMDNLGRAIITDTNNTVNFIGLNDDKTKLEIKQSFSLAGIVPAGTQVAQVTPDYEGRYWYMSLGSYNKETGEVLKNAYIGFYDMMTGESDIKIFNGEVIENGFAVDHSGIYVVTDHQMLKLSADNKAKINTIWAENYARATKPKPGTISKFGSGTSPTLIGDDLVAISDNADGQVNLVVWDRRDEPGKERLICKVPTFKMNKSANENSVVGYRNSIVVQNWYNAPSFFGKLDEMEPGVMRIDVRADRTGCDVVWENYEVAATSTMKLSTGSGYLYAPIDIGKNHYMTYIDFETGKVDQKIYMNKGLSGRFMASPVFFGPNNELIQPHFSGMTVIKEK